MNTKLFKPLLFLFYLIGCFTLFIGNAQSQNSIEDERAKQLKEMGVNIPNPENITKQAAEIFSKPVFEQDFKALENLAKDANTFSNLVSRLSDEYDDYLRQNSRYEFVTKEVKAAPARKEYAALDNKFKRMRNQAYLNLGKLSLADGKQMQAFLFFKDAYRLSPFTCHQGKDNCMRYQAEQELKKMLGVSSDSYVHWEK